MEISGIGPDSSNQLALNDDKQSAIGISMSNDQTRPSSDEEKLNAIREKARAEREKKNRPSDEPIAAANNEGPFTGAGLPRNKAPGARNRRLSYLRKPKPVLSPQNQALGAASGTLLAASIFAPLVRAPFFGGLSALHNHPASAIAIICAGVLIIAFSIANFRALLRGCLLVAVASIAINCAYFEKRVSASSSIAAHKVRELYSSMPREYQPLDAFERRALKPTIYQQMVTVDWGWIILVPAVITGFIAAFVDLSKRKK